MYRTHSYLIDRKRQVNVYGKVEQMSTRQNKALFDTKSKGNEKQGNIILRNFKVYVYAYVWTELKTVMSNLQTNFRLKLDF